jgi:ketosteroid isomerase-like protein
MRKKNLFLIVAAMLLAPGTIAVAHPEPHAQASAPAGPKADADTAKVVDAFHAALASGDTAAASGYLADAVIIYEAGGAERSKSEYAGAHLPADAEYAKAVGADLVRRNGGVSGDLAWVASEGRTKGQFKGRDVDQITTESMILRRTAGAWRIVHVHWSSRAATAAR